MRFLTWLLTTAAALAVATWLIPGISFVSHDGETGQNVLRFLVVALILGVVNSVVGPILKVLGLPFVILTLGLFLWFVNAWMLMLTSWFSDKVGLGFDVTGFGTALLGALVITLVNWGISTVLDNDR